ncbi:hypothetical protein PIB30_083500, partial [Stylosanthes scabra]|nr:hypothetical protein [Stylosanthes scabra]
VPRLLELRRGSVIVPPPPAIIMHVRAAGFEGPLMMRDFDIDGPFLHHKQRENNGQREINCTQKSRDKTTH